MGILDKLKFGKSYDDDIEEPYDPTDNRVPEGSVPVEIAKGTLDSFTDTDITDQAGEVLTQTFGVIGLGDNFQELNKVRSGVQSVMREHIDTLRVNAEPLVSTIQSIIPKNSKLQKLFKDQQDDNGYNSAQEEENKSKAYADGVFGASDLGAATAEQTAIISKSVNQSGNRLLALQATSHDMGMKYYRKSIEMKFKQYEVSKNILGVMKSMNSDFLSVLRTINKNVALPDFVKLNKTEALEQALRTKVFNKLFDSVGSSSLSERVVGNFKSISSEFIAKQSSNLEIGKEMAEAYQSGADALDEDTLRDLGVSRVRAASGGVTGSLLRGYMGRQLGNLLNKLPGMEERRDRIDGYIENIGGELGDRATEALDKNQKLRFLGYDFLSRLTNDNNQFNNDFTSSSLDPKQPAIFTNRIADSITKTIPGLLSKILKAIGGGNVSWDFGTSRFVDNDEESIKNVLRGSIDSGLESDMKRLKEAGLTSEEVAEVTTYINTASQSIDRKNLGRTDLDENIITKLEALYEKDGDKDINELFKSISSNSKQYGKRIEEFHESGMTDTLQKMGIVKYDEVGDRFVSDSDAFQKLMKEMYADVLENGRESVLSTREQYAVDHITDSLKREKAIEDIKQDAIDKANATKESIVNGVEVGMGVGKGIIDGEITKDDIIDYGKDKFEHGKKKIRKKTMKYALKIADKYMDLQDYTDDDKKIVRIEIENILRANEDSKLSKKSIKKMVKNVLEEWDDYLDLDDFEEVSEEEFAEKTVVEKGRYQRNKYLRKAKEFYKDRTDNAPRTIYTTERPDDMGNPLAPVHKDSIVDDLKNFNVLGIGKRLVTAGKDVKNNVTNLIDEKLGKEKEEKPKEENKVSWSTEAPKDAKGTNPLLKPKPIEAEKETEEKESVFTKGNALSLANDLRTFNLVSLSGKAMAGGKMAKDAVMAKKKELVDKLERKKESEKQEKSDKKRNTILQTIAERLKPKKIERPNSYKSLLSKFKKEKDVKESGKEIVKEKSSVVRKTMLTGLIAMALPSIATGVMSMVSNITSIVDYFSEMSPTMKSLLKIVGSIATGVLTYNMLKKSKVGSLVSSAIGGAMGAIGGSDDKSKKKGSRRVSVSTKDSIFSASEKKKLGKAVGPSSKTPPKSTLTTKRDVPKSSLGNKVGNALSKSMRGNRLLNVGKRILGKVPMLGSLLNFGSSINSLVHGKFKEAGISALKGAISAFPVGAMAVMAYDVLSPVFEDEASDAIQKKIADKKADTEKLRKEVVELQSKKSDVESEVEKTHNEALKARANNRGLSGGNVRPAGEGVYGSIDPTKRVNVNNVRVGNVDKALLERIAKGETAVGARGYNMIYGDLKSGKQKYKRAKPVSSMTLKEIYALQKGMLSVGSPSTAVGKYQMLRDVLKEEARKAKIPDSAIFTPELQDKLILNRLIRKRKYDEFKKGKLKMDDFIHKLSLEFASIEDPVLGQSHYGQGMHTTAKQLRAVLSGKSTYANVLTSKDEVNVSPMDKVTANIDVVAKEFKSRAMNSGKDSIKHTSTSHDVKTDILDSVTSTTSTSNKSIETKSKASEVKMGDVKVSVNTDKLENIQENVKDINTDMLLALKSIDDKLTPKNNAPTHKTTEMGIPEPRVPLR